MLNPWKGCHRNFCHETLLGAQTDRYCISSLLLLCHLHQLHGICDWLLSLQQPVSLLLILSNTQCLCRYVQHIFGSHLPPSSTCVYSRSAIGLHVQYVVCAASVCYNLRQQVCECTGSSKYWHLFCIKNQSISSVADLYSQEQTHQHCYIFITIPNLSERCHDRNHAMY